MANDAARALENILDSVTKASDLVGAITAADKKHAEIITQYSAKFFKDVIARQLTEGLKSSISARIRLRN